MTTKAPYRVLQPSTTTGTGAYSLGSATAANQAFSAAYTNGDVVPYFATDNSNGYEIGLGTLNTGVSPNTLARTTIILSSNSNAAVSWGVGVRSVAAWEAASAKYTLTAAGNYVADLTDWGNLVIHTGNGGNTFTLPALTAVPLGYSVRVMHTGSSTLTTAVNGADAVLGGVTAPVLSQGQIIEFIKHTSGWAVSGVSSNNTITASNLSDPLGLAHGGTNAALTADAGAIPYSTGTALALLAHTTTAGQLLLSGNAAAPTWSTVTHPSTTTANQILYSSSANTLAGLATAANGVLVTDGSSVPSISATLPSAVQGNITTVGTIGTGVWSGTAVAATKGGTGLTSGTSGGIPYFSSTTAIASSALLTANAPVIGGGAGVAPTVGSRSGNTTTFATTTGSLTSTHIAVFDASGNIVDGGAITSAVVTGYISGFTLSNDGGTPNTKLDIAAGYCADSTNAVMITGTAFVKSTGGSWTAGTGNNGMGSGLTIANSTWYHVFAIINNGSYDAYFDTSVTAANKPASTTAFRRVGSFLTDGSAHIIAFVQVGNVIYWPTALVDSSGTPPSSATLLTITIPLGVQVYPLISAKYNDTTPAANNGLKVWSPSQSATVQDFLAVGAPVANINIWGNTSDVLSNTSSQVYWQSSGATSATARFVTNGWRDPHIAYTW